MNSFWLHPALILILGALLLPLVPARIKKAYLVLIPALVFVRTLNLSLGVFGHVQFLDWGLVFGRVDKLSLVFGYIMSLMCILGTLYGLHVKENAQHMAAWIYVAGSIGAIYAGDFITLFLFWEVMAFSSVFLIWFRRRPESLGAGLRYLLVHVAGGLALLGGMVLHCRTTGSWSFDALDVHHPTAAIYLILIGFILNAAVPPFHAAWATPVIHDTRSGLRINANCQVVDINGEVAPGLCCGGESVVGFSQPGLARAACQGYIAGRNAAVEPAKR